MNRNCNDLLKSIPEKIQNLALMGSKDLRQTVLIHLLCLSAVGMN